MKPRARALRPDLAGALLLAALVAPALVAIGAQSDYAVHAGWGAELARSGETSAPVPAPLFAWLVMLGVWLLPGPSPLSIGLGIGFASHLASYLVLLHLLRGAPGAAIGPAPARAPSTLPQVAVALALCVAAPIPFGSADEPNLYLGYIGLATYHNPTMTLLRPLALLLFLAAESALRPAPAGPAIGIPRSAGLAAAAALAKPSFSVALLPALAASAWLARRAGQRVALRQLLVGIALPTLAVLAFEYAQTFSQPAAGGAAAAGIRIAPLAALRAGASGSGSVALRLLLSIAFPLGVALCAPRRAARDPGLRLAWLCSAAGLASALLLDETGPRAGHGNFLWSAQISLGVLFAISARWWCAEGSRGLGRRRSALVAGLLALHALCGLYWLGVHWLPLVDASARPLREWF